MLDGDCFRTSAAIALQNYLRRSSLGPVPYRRFSFPVFCLLLFIVVAVSAPGLAQAPPQQIKGLLIILTDENSVVVPQARATLENAATHTVIHGQTDSTGRLFLQSLPAGT